MKKLSKKQKEKLRIEKKQLKLEKRKKKKKLNIDLKPIVGGAALGIANIIPGVSGGTMLVIFNLFDKLMFAISDVFKRKTTTRKESILFLLKVLIGAAAGVIIFAKLIGLALTHLEAETIFLFMGLILFSIPIIIKEEMKGQKFNIIFFLIGFILIGLLQYFRMQNPTNSLSEDINIIHYLMLLGLGLIGGATMIFPGVSGSMLLLVLGKYELIRSYIDELTKLNMIAFSSLCVFGIGVVLGIVLSAKLTNYLLNNYKGKTISLILGFITSSALILPFNIENSFDINTLKICTLLTSFILGGSVIYYINRLQVKNGKDN